MHLTSTPSSLKHKSNVSFLPNNMICFSHLRWDFVFQRPQHLITRFSKAINTFFIEEPVAADIQVAHYAYSTRARRLTIITPQLPKGLTGKQSLEIQQKLFNDFMIEQNFADYAFWYYTPMALEFTRQFNPDFIIFDCMDELSAFKFAPECIKLLEEELLRKADIVFTGGHSLFEAKKDQHNNIHSFPSSIDKAHFARTRTLKSAEPDHTTTLGFYGVIDERFDIDLIRGVAEMRPEWQIILIGPVVKIDPCTLPTNANITYIGAKTYEELPDMMIDWDLALIPFLLNESTRFISPTKTPEYLAAGIPVISTPIRDVINPYGKFGMVSIGRNAEDFVHLAEIELSRPDKKQWLSMVDLFLADNSWDRTCSQMSELICQTIKADEIVYSAIAQS